MLYEVITLNPGQQSQRMQFVGHRLHLPFEQIEAGSYPRYRQRRLAISKGPHHAKQHGKTDDIGATDRAASGTHLVADRLEVVHCS